MSLLKNVDQPQVTAYNAKAQLNLVNADFPMK